MVCGGKFSEGQNFSGDLCRGLFMVGVPNLYVGNVKLKMKKRFYQKYDPNNHESASWQYYFSKRDSVNTLFLTYD